MGDFETKGPVHSQRKEKKNLAERQAQAGRTVPPKGVQENKGMA